MGSSCEIRFKYIGKDVDNGSIAIEDMLLVLEGFKGIYGRIVDFKQFKSRHELRLSGLEKGSIDILIDVLQFAEENKDHVAPLIAVLGSEIKTVVALIKNLIDITALTRREKFKIEVGDNYGTQNIIYGENIKLIVQRGAIELFEEKGVKSNLAKISKPIEKGKIDSAQITATLQDGEKIESGIDYTTKQYFEIEERETIISKDVRIEGMINMLRKSTNRGELLLHNGRKIPYYLKMDNPDKYYDFFGFRGPVKMTGIGVFDDSYEIKSIDVFDIQKVQKELL